MWEHLKGATTLIVIVAAVSSAVVWSLTTFIDLAETLIERYTVVIEMRQSVICTHVQHLEKKHLDVHPKIDCNDLDLHE